MPKRIMTIAILFFIITILALSQVFVDKNFVPVSFKEFISPRFWQDIITTVDRQDVLFLGCDQSSTEQVPDEVVGVYQDTTVIARNNQDATWSLIQKDDDGSEQVLVESIQYRNPYQLARLTRSLGSISRYVIYPECERSCVFRVYDLETNKLSEMSVVTTGSDTHDESFSDLELVFYDEDRSRLVFSSREQQKAYVVSYNITKTDTGRTRPYLWHDIALKTNESTSQQIIGVAYDVLAQQHLLVTVTDSVSNTERLVLYNLTTPAVRLQQVPEGWIIQDDSWLVRQPDSACVPLSNESGETQYLNFE